MAKFAFQGLSGAFRARISTEVMGVPAELLYTGDGWLYTAVGSTRYKYELPDLGDGMDLQAVLGCLRRRSFLKTEIHIDIS